MSKADPRDWDDEQIDALLERLEERVDTDTELGQAVKSRRRDVLKAIGAVGAGGLAGAAGMEAATGNASAGSQQAGTLGEPGNPIDAVAEDIYGPGGQGSGDAVAFEAVQTREQNTTLYPAQRSAWTSDPGQAINDAIADLTDGTVASDGGDIELPPGRYTYSTDILFEGSITITGSGGRGSDSSTTESQTGTVLVYEGSGQAIAPADRNDRSDGVIVERLTVEEGDDASVTDALVKLDSWYNSAMQHVSVRTATAGLDGILLDAEDAGGFHNEFRHVNVSVSGTANAFNFDSDSDGGGDPNAQFLTDCNVSGDNPDSTGVRIVDGNGCSLLGGALENLGTGIKTVRGQEGSLTVVGTRFENVDPLTDFATKPGVFIPSMVSVAPATKHAGKEPSIDTSDSQLVLDSVNGIINVNDRIRSSGHINETYSTTEAVMTVATDVDGNNGPSVQDIKFAYNGDADAGVVAYDWNREAVKTMQPFAAGSGAGYKPEDLTSRSGSFDGETAYHDGTDGNNSNTKELARWDGADWQGIESGNVID